MSLRFKFLAAFVIAALHGAGASAGTLTVNFDTTPAGGNYNPRNIVAVWVVDGTGQFVKTIGRWADVRKNSLIGWTAASGFGDADAVSGATRANHNARLTATWDLKNKSGVEVANGNYTIRMELADRNSVTQADNNQGTFTFTKGANASNTTTSNGGFNNVNVVYSPTPSMCNNGRVDAGETCDPPGSCPTSCPTATDACMPLVLTGTAASCTAACVVQPVRLCSNTDGCCPNGCNANNDNDCAAGGGGGGGGGGEPDNSLDGGCTTVDPSPGLLLVLFGLGMVTLRRRRK